MTYRDDDFLTFLGRTQQEENLVDELRKYLIDNDVINENNTYNKEAFLGFREEVKEAFSGSWTSITPVMERVMYMLTSVKRPNTILELGSFWGNTLAWFAGPTIGKSQQYLPLSVVGVDVDKKMCEKAWDNFSRIENAEHVKIIHENALDYVASLDEKIDFLYLEAKSEEEKDLYLRLLKLMEDKLADGAWIIAHDIYDKDQLHDFDEYLDYVRSGGKYKTSISIDVDFCGLELTIK